MKKTTAWIKQKIYVKHTIHVPRRCFPYCLHFSGWSYFLICPRRYDLQLTNSLTQPSGHIHLTAIPCRIHSPLSLLSLVGFFFFFYHILMDFVLSKESECQKSLSHQLIPFPLSPSSPTFSPRPPLSLSLSTFSCPLFSLTSFCCLCPPEAPLPSVLSQPFPLSLSEKKKYT